jgi:folate-dependent phosphoribosylglycinamide formyltransferase PurN
LQNNHELKIVSIGGNHNRHLYYINTIQKNFYLSGSIIEKRENSLPKPPKETRGLDKKNFIKHFHDREKAEKKYFGKQKYPQCDILEILSNELNTEKTKNFINKIKPDLVLIFGSGLIKNPLAKVLPKNTINLHLGLSPRYRGSATLFWPFYFLEPNFAGSTFHYIINEPDAGDIIHQVVPELDLLDGIHDVSCKAVISATNDAVILVENFTNNRSFKRFKQKSSGKNFLTKDFKPEHLRMIYNVYNNNIVKEYLNGNLIGKDPKLIKQF